MKARDLAIPFPAVREDQPALQAARLLVEEGRPGLIVVDEHDHPVAVLPGSQVLRLLIPGYIQSDPTLAAVVDDDFVDHMCDTLEGKTVAQLLRKDRSKLPLVEADDSVLQVAALMAAERSPLVGVVEGKGAASPLLGGITLSAVLGELLPTDRISGP
ncbi:CBS domain-containing protein [Nocardioides mangrovi]|uniref:CBS domain-containing protein n=1 Tax=Nocardioides mangrovi TaxID=2874580 RepID=A0ABS7UDZ7_9ACTN|nr:CBS domain-containing protein [Nocardioides mangrovi]MBZ5739079.1 CBS domain-containing protein [Nocardioides mangrovi]